METVSSELHFKLEVVCVYGKMPANAVSTLRARVLALAEVVKTFGV
jgi:hypothetical protein